MKSTPAVIDSDLPQEAEAPQSTEQVKHTPSSSTPLSRSGPLGFLSTRAKATASGSHGISGDPGSTRSALAASSSLANVAKKAISEQAISEQLDSEVLTWFKGRGIQNFHRFDRLIPAADELAQRKIQTVMLATGFSVGLDDHGAPLPETDGPPGTAALGHALMAAGKTVIFVTDSANEAPTKAALAVLNKDAAQFVRFENFDHKDGAGAISHADRLLDKHAPDMVVSVELPGRTANGSRRNMRGISIDDANGAVDQLMLQANERKIPTIGVGDGGNEAGMGGVPGIPLAKDGKTEMKSAVPARYPVTAWNSNLGAEALAAVVLQRHGKLDQLHTGIQQTGMIDAAMKAGAVDGVTRGKDLRQEVKVGEDTFHSGVDGFVPEKHNEMLESLKEIVKDLPPSGIAEKSPDHDQPFLIAAFDSSNGGLIAAKNLAGYLRYRTPDKARFAVVVDHGNAPYGPKTPGDLVKLVGDGLKISEQAGVDAIAMACNTACTALPKAKDDKDIQVPVLDLIKVTAEAIKQYGGTHPVILATQATVDSKKYQDEGKREGNRVSAYAAPNWAPYINDLKKPDEDPVVLNDIHRVVDAMIADAPDATSIWLCCTHYPAFKPFIEAHLKEKGLSHIKVIDPMSFQADAIISEMGQQKNNAQHQRFKRRDQLDFYVVTSGNNAEVEKSAKTFLGNKANFLVEHADFSRDFNAMNLREAFGQAESPASPNASTSSSTKRLRSPSPPPSRVDTIRPRQA